jgi:putative spermidine/putrescine transport system ATP-binding protein
MALSDRIVVMNHGRIEQIGRPDETYERPKTAFVANFLGKTNNLRGTSSGGPQATLTIGDGRWTLGPVPAGAVGVSVRPEKIAFADAGLSGTLRNRVFQDSHWLCQVETAVGEVTVIRQNTGAHCPEEGSSVMLSWCAEDMLVTPAKP